MKKLICVFALVIISVFSLVSCKADDYNKALELIEAGENEEAYELLKSVGFYKNARKMLKDFYFVPTRIVCSKGTGGSAVLELTYGDNHFPMQYTLTHFDRKTSTGVYEYDDNGFLISARFNEPHGVTERKNVYNSKGLLATRLDSLTYNNTSRAFVHTCSYVYDEEDRLVELDYNDGSKWEYTYDEDGNLVKKVYVSDIPALRQCLEYTYDDKGQKTAQKTDDISAKFKLVEYFYDSEGRRVKVVCTRQSEVKDTIQSFYDDNGLLVKETREDVSGRQKTVDTVEIEYKCIYIPYEVPKKAIELFDANNWRWSSFWWDP